MALVFPSGISLFVLLSLHRNGKRNRRLSGIRQREVFLQGVGGKFLAHTRAVQHASRAVVDERGSIDAPFLRVAQYGVDALSFEGGYKLLLVIRAFQHGKDGAFRPVGKFPVLNLLLGTGKLLLYGFIAHRLPEQRGFERIADLVALVVRGGIDQPVIFTSAHIAMRFLHRHII